MGPDQKHRRRLKARLRKGCDKRRKLRNRHNAAQKNICAICREPMGADVTLDHIEPVSAGGRTTEKNTRAAHRLCNQNRGNAPVEVAA